MFVSLQSSYVEILVPSGMAFGGETTGVELGLEGRALSNGISTLMKGPPATSFFGTNSPSLYQQLPSAL